MFVTAYGAEAGNLALRAVATAGVYIGGGIAPKILPALESGLFLDAFRAKEPMAGFRGARFPVAVILNPEAGLLGAAVHANGSRVIRSRRIPALHGGNANAACSLCTSTMRSFS